MYLHRGLVQSQGSRYSTYLLLKLQTVVFMHLFVYLGDTIEVLIDRFLKLWTQPGCGGSTPNLYAMLS